VAGTREPTPAGRWLARELGRRLAERGHTAVTGLARGIDEEAALGALKAGGPVVGVVPYLFEGGDLSELNPRAAWLFWHARKLGALRNVAVVAEHLVKDKRRVREWLAARNRIIACMAAALVVPEARFRRARWGTRYAVEYALMARRLVIVLEPRVEDGDVIRAFEYFRSRGAAVAGDIDGVLSATMKQCHRIQQGADPRAL
jgi:predicted Rossmann fold nucleotide-binding protein DprA/Smf involved in DNA uptake